MSLEAVLFDKDGVLIDFQATWGRWAASLLQRLSGGDAAVYDRLAAAIRFYPATGEFAADSVAIAGTPWDLAQALHGALGGAWTTADLETLLSQDAIDVDVAPPVPLRPTFEALATSGLKLGVVTNDAEDAARSHVATLGISDLFGCVVGYDSGFGAKPGPGSVLGACELLGVAPDKAAMVGDSLHDLHAARAAGTAAVGVLTGTAVR
ncbi:MAG: HAD family hydrolase, partial [Pseudomonadota bacterium]